MKIYAINPFNPYFKGKREDRKSVEQLKKDNSYDLNLINRRKISNAIENLAEVSGEDNVNFLLDVAENLKYGTNIDLGKQPYNDWQVKLNSAAKKSLSLSDSDTQKRLSPRLEALFSSKKDLNEQEAEILNLKNSILENVDRNLLNSLTNKNIKNIDNNLDYFIISSEIPLSQKLYILKRLNYFMSPDYKINPQLKDKKTQAIAEIINDLVVDTPESKIPNIKAVNQKTHGMCAAISICRKALAYEDKANYVDMILSELDDSKNIQVYDITKLGSHTKIPVAKADIDYDYALSLGYRIIDTSALNWMNVANTTGAANDFVGVYKSFDKNNFDVFKDSHLTVDLADETLVNKQDWYRTLLKAKSVIGGYKTRKITQKYKQDEAYNQQNARFQAESKWNALLISKIENLAPTLPKEKLHKVFADILKLEVRNSDKAKKVNDYKKDFVYLPNEPEKVKIEKIKAFLTIALSENNKSVHINDNDAKSIMTLVSEIKGISRNNAQASNYTARKIYRAEALYNAAAAYRIQQIYQIFIPEYLNDMANNLNIPDNETLICKNMDYLISKLESNKINPELKEALAKNFSSDVDNEALIEALKANRETLDYILNTLMDDLYASCLSINRKQVLANELTGLKNAIVNDNDKQVLLKISDKLHIKDNKKLVTDTLDKYIKVLESDDCTQEQYLDIFNKTGHKSQMLMFKETFERLENALFDSKEANSAIIQGFNLINGLPKDASKQQTVDLYNRIADSYNKIAGLIGGYQQALEITGSNGEVLNTVNPKRIVIRKLENIGEIIPEKDMQLLQNKFTGIENAMASFDNENVSYKDLPKELTTFTPREEAILNNIESHINGWYSTVSRALDAQYRELKEPLSELHRQIGLKTGNTWIGPEGHSGLSSSQMVRIVEYMTDRPYYIENNGKYAVKKIKLSPYSGMSSTSVYDRSPAWHAQYIADIRPIEVNINSKKGEKEAIFHDNTWGPIEHKNTWVDDNGLLRTDYSNAYGGALGYITDDDYLSGKFIENIIGAVGQVQPNNINNKMYKRLAGNSDGYKYPMFADIITPGRFPSAEKYVRMIRDNTLISPDAFLPQLEKYAQNMTQAEIKSVIVKAETISDNLEREYTDIEDRILGKEPFQKGIVTKEDFESLPDDDKLKLLFEKMAVIRSFKGIPNQRIFYTETSMKDLANIRKQIKTEARKNFDYTFAKNPDIVRYGAESVRQEVYALLDGFAKVNNIKITDGKKVAIVNSLKQINKEEFNGSLDKTIDLMINSFKKSLFSNTSGFENKKEKVENMANNVRNLLRANMGFTLADLGSSSFDDDNMQDIVRWIDKVFDPATDEELVQIFNNLRNMTTDEFNQKYNDKITDEAIGIKPVTGYDILTQFRGMDNRTHNLLYNIMFNQRLGLSLNMSKIIPTYDYNKFNRKLRGATYVKGQRTFDDIYFDYYYSLKTLTLGKRYEALRQGVFDKYNMYPAYPKFDSDAKMNDQEVLKKLYNDISDEINAIDAYKLQDESLTLVHNMKKYVEKLPAGTLTSRQYNKLHNDFEKLLKMNENDDYIPKTLEAIRQALDLDKNASGEVYKSIINQIDDELSNYETTIDGKTMKDAVNSSRNTIADCKNEIVHYIDPKYQSRAMELLNKWISAMAKQHPDCDKYYEEFCDIYYKHVLPKSPEKLLNEYLLLLAKPDNSSSDLEQTKHDNEQIQNLKNSLQADLQGLLYQANLLEMQYILMNCAGESNLNVVRDEFKKSKLQLRNGSVVTLDSDIAIDIMLAPLLADTDLESAVMFLEQLGLAEQVVTMAAKNNSFDKAKKCIKRINNIFSSVSKQTQIVQDELNKLGNIDDDPNYTDKLDKMHENLVRRFRNTNYRITIKIIDQAFKDLEADIKQHPNRSKTALLHLKMDEVKSASIAAATLQVQQQNARLANIQKMKDLVYRLALPENSPAIQAREDYLKGFQEVEKYVAANTKNYSNLDLTTGAAEAID